MSRIFSPFVFRLVADPDRLFNVIDDYTGECHAIIVDVSINGQRVARELTRLIDLNGRVRDECLNESLFSSLREAQETTARWRNAHNMERPHSALNWATPNEFA